MLKKILEKWKQYRYRFMPWLLVNFKHRSMRQVGGGEPDTLLPCEEVSTVLATFFEQLHQHAGETASPDITDSCPSSPPADSLTEHALWEREMERSTKQQAGCPHIAHRCLSVMFSVFGFCIERRPSVVAGAGTGVLVTRGRVNKHTLVALYPGTVYLPSDAILFQSISNAFIFRCIDRVLVDGNDKGLSRYLYRSCCYRNRAGPYFTCDMSWLSEFPTNTLAVGQYVNNGNKEHPANVTYQEVDIPACFPPHLRRFLPNVFYSPNLTSHDSHRLVRTVALVSLRDIEEGEELFSNYFTVVH